MNLGFWEHYTKKQRGDGDPFFCLAPMADVTDAAFRQIISKYSRHGEQGGGPDILWTEFVSADGLSHELGRKSLMLDLSYTESERPIVAQLFSSNPEKMRIGARIAAELGFDGIDINMGCPDKTIEKQGCGSAMIKTPDIAALIIQAVKDGIKDAGKDIPVSVKTRVGYNTVEIDTWIPFLLSQDIAALTVHARTRKEMSKVPARWEHIQEVVAIRDRMNVNTVIIGNGDVMDVSDGIQKAQITGCDGVMIGRAVFGNPWIFDRNRDILRRPTRVSRFVSSLVPSKWMKKILGSRRYTVSHVSTEDRLRVLIEHSKLFEELLGSVKHFSIMKKHFKAYIQGFSGAKELRTELMEEGNSASAVEKIIETYISSH